jgi:hypothetical protein
MDTIIYLSTAAITVVWSVWIYLWWESRAGLSEETGLRLILIVAPSSYFLLIAVSGWAGLPDFRLDLAALVLLDAVTVIAGVFLSTLLRFPRVNDRRAYLTILTLYNIIAVAEIVFVYVVRSTPSLLIRVAGLAGEWQHLDFLSFSWLGAPERSNQPDLIGLLNKILIALLSYIPVSIIRYIGSVRLRRKLENELKTLKSRVERLEQYISERDSGVVK